MLLQRITPMTNYNVYKAEKGISNNDMIRAVKPRFPKYSKVHQSMVVNAEQSGVCLVPEAEYLLVDHFGFGPGLSIIDDGTYTPQPVPPQKKKPNRKKPHGYTVRFNAALNEAVRAQMARLNISTMQEYIEEAVNFFLQCGLGEG